MNLKSFKLDKDGDLVFGGHRRLQMVEGLEAQKQRIRLRLGTHVQEWFLDTSLGVPWLRMMGKAASENVIRAEITKALYQDNQVQRVISLNIGKLNGERQLPIDFEVQLKDGSILGDMVEVNL